MTPKRHLRRKHILSTAARLFARHGYHNTSITHIVNEAGIARGTFYLYFDNKQAIFEELVNDILDRILASIHTVRLDVDASPRDQLIANLVGVFSVLRTHRDQLAILLRGTTGLDPDIDAKVTDFFTSIHGAVRRAIALGHRMGLVRACDPTVVAAVVLGALKEIACQALSHTIDLDDEAAMHALASSLLETFASGILMDGTRIP